MKRNTYCSAAILLLSSMPKMKCAAIKNWFKKSRFVTCEAADISQALEMISDFTVRQRPNVVLLATGSFTEDLPLVNKMVSTASPDGGGISLLALYSSDQAAVHKDYFEGSFAQVKTELNKILPKHKLASTTAA